MERALDAITLDVDKSETGIVYAAVAQAMAEVALAYIELENFYNLIFAQTSSGEWLEKRTEESSVYRRKATKTIRRAKFNIPVADGERFFIDDIYYKVVGDDQVECEEAGTIGNRPLSGSSLLPLNNIPGLEIAEIGDIIIAGAEEESDESLLDRYLAERRKEAGSANKAHYKKWAEEVEGVGKATVIPLWDGRGTVKIIITDSEMKPASDELTQRVKNKIDPYDGLGSRDAPVGSTVTVVSSEYVNIKISAIVTLKGNSIENVTKEIEEAIKKLFKEIALRETEDGSGTEIKISAISNILYENEWINDYSGVEINDSSKNLQISDHEIPNLIEVILHE